LTTALATAATATSPAGSYPITQGTLAASPNYRISFVDGVLTVVPPPATLPILATFTVPVAATQKKPGASAELSLAAIDALVRFPDGAERQALAGLATGLASRRA